jgi:hypothetical protein
MLYSHPKLFVCLRRSIKPQGNEKEKERKEKKKKQWIDNDLEAVNYNAESWRSQCRM